MKRSTSAAVVLAAAVGIVGLGVAPAHAGIPCTGGNICSYDLDDLEGTQWAGASTDFVEVPDDVTNSTANYTSRSYNVQNNTAFAQEQTIFFISAGGEVFSYSGNNNVLDHYRAA